MIVVKCKSYNDTVKAIEQDYPNNFVFVDWVNNKVHIEGPGSGDFKQDTELAYVQSLLPVSQELSDTDGKFVHLKCGGNLHIISKTYTQDEDHELLSMKCWCDKCIAEVEVFND